MMTVLEPPSVLSSPQRRCQALLMLYLPGQTMTAEYIGAINNVDVLTARQDIVDTGEEIARYHRLAIATQADGSYRIEGTALNLRLCLLHWLRRALRLCPRFVAEHFTPAIKTQLKQLKIARTLYDETNLQALVNRCARGLQREFEHRDGQFLRLYLQYCLLQHHQGISPVFNPQQSAWTQPTDEFHMAADIVHHWQRRVMQIPHPYEQHFLALLFMLLKIPNPHEEGRDRARQLHLAIVHMVDRFQQVAGCRFTDERGLHNQLYVHLSQALNRCVFEIGIDHHLPEEIHRLYPRLIRTTRTALADFEASYTLRFSDDEAALVAIIFGAGLMQESELHEKQVVLLTGDNPTLEQEIEQQLRELTLLPLNVKYLAAHTFQKEGAPKDSTLVISPYAIVLPLFSPPLIHAEQSLSEHQQQRICQILET
ncbi:MULTISPECIES: stationary phase inducible protein CsiE [Enterobacteriaceae]|uniref:Stationary phase inducible protein CsiE n=1 Tax=Kluyvera genomosp. 2 TaxID=2774054 RepID=A0A2T2Y7Q2_9ENTR|nr:MULTISPECIES: stationary phase inducible protein CsiE [Enterobacteriaceae]HAT3916819.1 stationary phase inducible protein CsiE [Kluyvera ascorbata]PSR48468.1 stationary phase inducible protein CsiE [Kluyvera genomosp. 2]BBQ82766.1 stationary phase inducible protein CsiE [Klebsiella sp. WP3-W18-ESBL-02]BBR19801.1 stationary phase inducible protein CsiE [Klebsiella sp. WP3-S18-ESBL-05]BBR59974.1 stationary phase inducible protein CsiE [Klebsiella sp. WP4-W18-ESBL-05]